MFTIKRDELKVVMERTFDAPREAVFQAFIDPHAIPKWWGPRNQATTVDKMDVRVDGVWRFVCRDNGGNEYAFHGVHKEIDPPKLLSSIFNFEGIPGDHELIQTVTFEDRGGTTKVTGTATYANVEDLDGMEASGMESGWTESWERLAELAEKRIRKRALSPWAIPFCLPACRFRTHSFDYAAREGPTGGGRGGLPPVETARKPGSESGTRRRDDDAIHVADDPEGLREGGTGRRARRQGRGDDDEVQRIAPEGRRTACA
jgi:uncharacterized protein YndB with AHSA1/START domain